MDLNFLHFDLDAFFASCEILDNPKLKHVPMVVGGKSQRGIITTANYEARKYGLHSAMPIFQAKKIVPNLVIVTPDFEKYRRNSEKVFKVLSAFSTKIQKMSIDEGCMDISHIDMDRLELANLIQENVRIKTGLSISIGISYNMSLAKLASDWNKPHGIKIITQDDIPDILMIYDRIRGVDDRQLDLSRIRKSIGVEYTFERDLKNYNELLKKASEFSEELAEDLHKKNIKAKTITIKIKLSDFSVITKSMTLDEYICDVKDIYRIVKYLVVNTKIEKPVRLFGITAANLSDTTFEQLKFL